MRIWQLLVRATCVSYPWWQLQVYVAIVNAYFFLLSLFLSTYIAFHLLVHVRSQEADFWYATLFYKEYVKTSLAATVSNPHLYLYSDWSLGSPKFLLWDCMLKISLLISLEVPTFWWRFSFSFLFWQRKTKSTISFVFDFFYDLTKRKNCTQLCTAVYSFTQLNTAVHSCIQLYTTVHSRTQL